MGRFMQIYISLSWTIRSDLNGQLDLMLDGDAVEYKPNRECLKTGLVKRLDQESAPKKVTWEKMQYLEWRSEKVGLCFSSVASENILKHPPPLLYSVFVCIFAFSVIAFPNSLSALPLGFVEFSSRIAPMHASSANTFVFKQLDEAALTEKDPTLTFAE